MTDRFRLSLLVRGPGWQRARVRSDPRPPRLAPNGPPAPQTPTFSVNVELRRSRCGRDRSRRPVRPRPDAGRFSDLRGRQAAVRSPTFSSSTFRSSGSSARSIAPEPIEPDVKSNERPFDGRVYVMVVDDLHTDFEPHAAGAGGGATVHPAAPWRERSDGDRPHRRGRPTRARSSPATSGCCSRPSIARSAASSIRRRSRRTAAGAAGQQSRTASARRSGRGSERAERQTNARQSLTTLRDVADWFATVRGRRKAILFVSEGIDYDITDFGNAGASMIMDYTRETLAAAARGNVSIYGIDPRGLTNPSAETIEFGSLPRPRTSGSGSATGRSRTSCGCPRAACASSPTTPADSRSSTRTTFATAFDRIVRDNSSYYAMAYYPPTDKAGKFHKIEVQGESPRPGGPRPAGLRDAEAAGGARRTLARRTRPTAKLMTPELRDALDSPLPVSGLTMKVFASPFKGSGAERLGAPRRRGARPRPAAQHERQGRRHLRGGRCEGQDPHRQHRHGRD